jgi:Tol biopolymer transport system component
VSDLWVLEPARGTRTRVTFNGTVRFFPIWTRDGAQLTYADNSGAANQIWMTQADGTGRPKALTTADTRRFPTSWSPDGRVLLMHVGGADAQHPRDIWQLDTSRNPSVLSPLIEGPFQERGGLFSPDGHWVAYVSNKSGQDEIYIRPYPGPGLETVVSVNGGKEPVWGPNGRELVYRSDRRLMSVSIDTSGAAPKIGTPVALFDAPYATDTWGTDGAVANYDIAPDGQSFFFVSTQRTGSEPPRLHLVLNWADHLGAR